MTVMVGLCIPVPIGLLLKDMADTFGIELPLCLNFSSEIWDEAEESFRALFEFVDNAAERVGNRSVSLSNSNFVGALPSFTFLVEVSSILF